MGNKRIYGVTVEIDGNTTGLAAALKDTNKTISQTQAQLRDVEKLLKMDPTNVELLAQKQRLLAEAVDSTGEKLETLKDAEKQVQAQFKRGDIGRDQYDALKREVIATENKLDGFRQAARQTERAINGIDEDPVEDVADAAKQAEGALDDAGREAADFGDVLTAGAIVEGAKGLASAIGDMAEETAEYRRIMGTLEVSSEAAGYSAEQTDAAYKELYGVLGDDQAAATTLANLQAIGLSQDDLMRMIRGSTGAWAKYGDSIPIDGLAEAINETVKAGQVTGTFADALNWGSREGETFGVTFKAGGEEVEEWNEAVAAAETAEDFFNLALQDCSTEAERANLIMQAMADQGLQDAGDAWNEHNRDLVDANKAEAEFAEKAAEVGERLQPVMTEIREGSTDLLGTILEVTEQIPVEAIVAGIGKVFAAISKTIVFLVENKETVLAIILAITAGIAAMKLASLIDTISRITSGVTTLGAAFPKLGSAIGLLTNPIFLVVAAVVALVTLIATKGDEIQAKLAQLDAWLQNIFATDWTETFGPVLGGILNGFFANVKNIWDSIKRIFDGIIDFIRGVFTGDWKRAWNGVKNIFGGIFDGLKAIAKAPLNGVIALLNGMIGSVNWIIEKINGISFQNPFTGKTIGFNIRTIGTIPYLAKGGEVLQGSAIVGEAGPELLTVAGGRTIVQPLGRGESPRKANAAGGTVNNYNTTQVINSPQRVNAYEAYRYMQQLGRQIERRTRRK